MAESDGHNALKWSSVALVVAGALFYILSVAGLFWAKPSPPTDLGVYSVTIILVGLGLGGLLLRWARVHPGESS